LHCKLQTRHLVRESALQEEQKSNRHYRKDNDKMWSWAPKGSPIPRRTGRLTVGRKINSTHNIEKHCKFDARGTVVPNTATASAPAVQIKLATFTCAESARCVFWFEETKSDATQVRRKFRTQYLKEPPSRLTVYCEILATCSSTYSPVCTSQEAQSVSIK
jgi:hypothetical protein